MKKIIIVLMFAITSLYATNNLQQFEGLSDNNAGRFGVGLGGSNGYSGLTGKLYLTDNTAIQGTVGQYGWGNNHIFLSGDFIMEMNNLLLGNENIRLPFYVGGGINMYHWSDYNSSSTVFGVSGVIGLALQFKMIPLELTFELKPTFYLSGGGYYTYGTGAIRWYF